MMQQQSRFSRTVANQAKMGAYYTDTEHCKDLSKFLSFPEADEVTCLEPSIGDGSAIKACIAKKEGDTKMVFGVELSDAMKQALENDPLLEEILIADFLDGVHITPQSFGFCFSNPPYMEVDGERLEKKFLEKIHRYLRKDGVLVYVIPENVFKEKSFFRFFYNRFTIHHAYRFRESEYVKWHQVAVIATRRAHNKNVLLDELVSALARFEQLAELPRDYDGEKVAVPVSKSEDVINFSTIVFPKERCLSLLMNGDLKFQMEEADVLHGRHMTMESYKGSVFGRPPIKPNKDSMYLLGVCGAGNGACGEDAEHNLHLQRGVVKTVEDTTVEVNEKGEEVLTVTTRAQITYSVIEQSGVITHLV